MSDPVSPVYSLRNDVEQFFKRFVADHAGAPPALTALAKCALRLGDVSDDQLAKHRTALRRLHKLLGLAVAIGDGHADDRWKKMQAERAAAGAATADVERATQ